MRFQQIMNNDIPPTISRSEVLKVIDTEGRRLIHIAAFYGALNILDLLITMTLQYDLKLTYEDHRGNTPLDMACIRGFGNPTESNETWNFTIGGQEGRSNQFSGVNVSPDIQKEIETIEKQGTKFEMTRRCACVLKLIQAKKDDGTKLIDLK